jgi:sporulation protein YlmC with PRC-barrel domain
MLRVVKELDGYAIQATDGVVGEVTDVLFDDESWVIRYLVVDTGNWLAGRAVLISPIAIAQLIPGKNALQVPMTMEQVRNSPDVDTHRPVSRQYEVRYFGYYGYYPYYWGTSALWGVSDYPAGLLSRLGPTDAGADLQQVSRDRGHVTPASDSHEHDDPHLRSASEVIHYHIEASDGGVGRVQGLLMDEETWAIRYLVVDTSNWWFGHRVLIAPSWLRKVSWPERTISVNLTQEAVRTSPPYHSEVALHRPDEIALHNYYRSAGYWANHVGTENPEYRVVSNERGEGSSKRP